MQMNFYSFEYSYQNESVVFQSQWLVIFDSRLLSSWSWWQQISRSLCKNALSKWDIDVSSWSTSFSDKRRQKMWNEFFRNSSQKLLWWLKRSHCWKGKRLLFCLNYPTHQTFRMYLSGKRKRAESWSQESKYASSSTPVRRSACDPMGDS